MLDRWKKVLDEEFFFQLMQKAPTCELEFCQDTVWQRLKRDSLGKYGPGILLELFGDAEAAYCATKDLEAKEAKARAPQEPRRARKNFMPASSVRTLSFTRIW